MIKKLKVEEKRNDNENMEYLISNVALAHKINEIIDYLNITKSSNVSALRGDLWKKENEKND